MDVLIQRIHNHFELFLKRWVAEGPTHHFALGVGHRATTIAKIADQLGIESVVVTPLQDETVRH